MKPSTHTENLSPKERLVRFIVGATASIAVLETSIIGTPVFTAINLLAIALVTTAVIGWDPVKSLSLKAASFAKADKPQGNAQHA